MVEQNAIQSVTCEDIMIYDFHKVVMTNDVSYLKKYHEGDLEVLWNDLLEQWSQLTRKGSNTYIWHLKTQIERLKNSIYRGHLIAKILFFGAPNKENIKSCYESLNKIGVKIKKGDDYEKASKILRSKEIKLEHKQLELKSLLPDDNKKVEWDLTKDLFDLTRALDLKYKINAKETSAKEYAIMVNEAQKK